MAKFDRRTIGYESYGETGYVDGIRAIGCGVGIYVVGAENLEINNPVVENCGIPAVAEESKALKINNFQIDGKVVKQIWGDFESLKVLSSGELVAVGQYVATKPKKEHVHHVNRKLGKYLGEIDAKSAMELVRLLLELARFFKE
ncbi:MAG: hypothetical protein AAF340_07325 [Pseudomonadota bacterium]